ncbi:DUF7657 domain-containing protein [Vibrio vulnificus]|uniref:DUF7657 domain-containing protein n=1 Tax=Vibrio vulnificus TaxID=672 RepID=UPI000DACDABD|nr:hypothetical protein [Vibrio vulnificus]RAH30973.1 hypothetical protein DOT36_03860 [Vibrio vulnificus]
MFAIKRLNLDLYDWICLALLIPITVFAITPSSYGIVLDMFGYHGEGLLWGTPRPIRSDEWSVWTPYMQMAVLNDFTRFNELSTYHQDLRGFNALPLWDWALVFKPFMWPFWIFEPARAFALHHGLIIVAFLIGWKKIFFQSFSSEEKYKHRAWPLSILGALILFFTGFIQFWWTTLGPILASTPWLLMLVIKWGKGTKYYLSVYYISVVWLLSHTYPPIIVSVAYFGIMILFIHHPRFFIENKVKLLFISIVCVIAVATIYIYFIDVIPVVKSTVYPGERTSIGGESHFMIWLSTIIPFITHSNYQDLLNLNICEVGSVSSLLPLLVICFIKPDWESCFFRRVLISSMFLFLFLSSWMLFSIPTLVGKITLLSMVPGNRLLFVVGLIVTYLSLVSILTGNVKVTLTRVFLFLIFILLSYSIPTLYGLAGFGLKSAWELISIPTLMLLLLLLRFFKYETLLNNIELSFFWIALLINFVYFSHFNPLQTAFPIFEIHNRELVREIDDKREPYDPYWVAEIDFPGAVLSGLGLNSFTSVLIQPQLSLFRNMYSQMDNEKFNNIFNRYAHVWLSEQAIEPYNPQADVIVIPLRDVRTSYKPKEMLIEYNQVSDIKGKFNEGGHIDSIKIDKNLDLMQIEGWGLSSPLSISGPFDEADILSIEAKNRTDVARVLNSTRLEASGFSFVIANFSTYEEKLISEGLCLYSEDKDYGVRVLPVSENLLQYKCKN